MQNTHVRNKQDVGVHDKYSGHVGDKENTHVDNDHTAKLTAQM
jgi:hypothetical protein